MVLNVDRNHKAYRNQDRVEVGEEGETYRYTVTTRMTSALRWAAIGAILLFQ